MAHKRIEGAMVVLTLSPVFLSLSYNTEKIEKVMKPIGEILTPFGVIATVAALFLLWHSLKSQNEQHNTQVDMISKHHDEQIKKMIAHHDEQIFNMNIQHGDAENQHAELIGKVHQQLLQMEADRREKILINHVIAMSNNISRYSEGEFNKGIYFVPYNEKNTKTGKTIEYVCVIFWSIRYRTENRDMDYLLDLKFAIFEISISIATSVYAQCIDESHVDALVEILNEKPKNQDLWDHSFSIPRFEKEHGQVVKNKSSFFDPSKLEINEVTAAEFHVMTYSMAIIQSLDTDMMKLCADIARRVNV